MKEILPQAGQSRKTWTPPRRSNASRPARSATPTTGPQGRLANPEKVLVSTYRNGRITQVTMPAQKAAELDVNDVDYHRDEVFGRHSIRTESGGRLEYDGEIRHGGDVTVSLLTDLMSVPGEYQSRESLSRNPNLRSFRNKDEKGFLRRRRAMNAVAARLRALRIAFEDLKKPYRYFLTARRLGTCWNRERSWRIVEHLPEPVKASCPVAPSPQASPSLVCATGA
jgi:hypothetical protein